MYDKILKCINSLHASSNLYSILKYKLILFKSYEYAYKNNYDICK